MEKPAKKVTKQKLNSIVDRLHKPYRPVLQENDIDLQTVTILQPVLKHR